MVPCQTLCRRNEENHESHQVILSLSRELKPRISKTDYRLFWWFTVDGEAAHAPLHRVDVGSVTGVSEVNYATIFRVTVRRMSVNFQICSSRPTRWTAALSGPIGTVASPRLPSHLLLFLFHFLFVLRLLPLSLSDRKCSISSTSSYFYHYFPSTSHSYSCVHTLFLLLPLIVILISLLFLLIVRYIIFIFS
jgi:hypothetical protein